MKTNFDLLWMLAEHLLLTGLPLVLAVCLAMRAGLRSPALLLAVGLAASGALAILSFWAYYGDQTFGQALSFFVVLASLQGIFVCWRCGLDGSVLRLLAPPLALWALGSGFVLFLGFLHGGADQPLLTSGTRYSHVLPFDNDIPRFFADWFYLHGHAGRPPPIGDWISSDRPPLQVGYVLAQRPFGWDGNLLHYEVLGVVVQQLWILGMWALLCAVRIAPPARGLAILAAMLSDVAILHGFYVWPKLIAAAFLLAALSLVLSPDWRQLRRQPLVAVAFAALCGCAMLAHGSSAFFLLVLPAAVAFRGLPDRRWIGIAALVGVALLGSWSAYQHFADPPGNRLVKWQLGGALEIDDRGSLEAIADGYREAGLGGTLDNKWHNLTEIVGVKWVGPALGDAAGHLGAGQLEAAAVDLRDARFYSLLPLLGILLAGPIAMALARARGRPGGREWRFSLFGFGFCAGACALWALLLFGGPVATTSMHVGSLAVPLLAICACVVGAFAVAPRFAAVLVGLDVLFVLAVCVPAVRPLPGTSYSALAGLLAALCLAGAAWVALVAGRR
jgi:hypothetical protein